VQRDHRVFLVTAGHCLVPNAASLKDFLAEASEVAARLMVPIERSTEGRQRGIEDYVSFSSVSCPIVNNSNGDFFGCTNEGSLDIAALEVNPDCTQLVDRIRKRSVVLPPTGEWFSRSMDIASKMSQSVPLIASGFPKQGTDSFIDYEARLAVSQGIHLDGVYVGTGPWPHTHTMRIRQGQVRIEPDGMSGGPIYMKASNEDSPPYFLVGIALRGGHGSDLIHFCAVDWLTNAIDGTSSELTHSSPQA